MSNSKTMTKTITRFHLDTPYDTDTPWPEISSNDQDTILELLCTLLNPIGLHRQNHITPSKGKRTQKRKRHDDVPHAIPNPPEISSQILVGFNSITRHLQDLSRRDSDKGEDGQEKDEVVVIKKVPYISAIFTTYPTPAQSILHSHIPLLVNAASLSHPTRPPIRLVRLPKDCESRLATTLNLPRVNFIALLEDAEGASVLVELIRNKVGVVDGIGLKRGDAIYRLPNIVGVRGKVLGMGRKERIAQLKEDKKKGDSDTGDSKMRIGKGIEVSRTK